MIPELFERTKFYKSQILFDDKEIYYVRKGKLEEYVNDRNRTESTVAQKGQHIYIYNHAYNI